MLPACGIMSFLCVKSYYVSRKATVWFSARSQYLSRFCQQMQVFAQVASPHKQNTGGCVTLCCGAADPLLTAGSGGISSRIDS